MRIPATGTERLNCVGPNRTGPVQCWAVWQSYPPPLPPQEMASLVVCVTGV